MIIMKKVCGNVYWLDYYGYCRGWGAFHSLLLCFLVTLGDDPIISSAPSAPGPNNDCIEEVADAMPADSDDDIIRSREKSDIWHEHDNVPLKKDCPASPFIHNLLRHATHAIDINDEANVKAVLARKALKISTITSFSTKSIGMQECACLLEKQTRAVIIY